MKKKNKFLAPLISILLVLAVGGGIFAYFATRPSDPINVYGIEECYLYSYYWDGGNTTEGIVTSDKLQTIYLSPSQEVTAVNVQMGQQVHVGDPLLTYDTTLSELTLERQKLDIERKKLLLDDYKKQLEAINKMKPISYGPTPTTAPTTRPTSTTAPVSNKPERELPPDGYLLYGSHAGTMADPLRVWVKDSFILSSESLRLIMEEAKLISGCIVVETRENNVAAGTVKNLMGFQVERVEIGNNEDPTDPTEPDPTETEPTEPQPTETDPTEPLPTETEPTEPIPTETDPTEPEPTETEPTEPVTEPDPHPIQGPGDDHDPSEPEPTETIPSESTTVSSFIPFENLIRLTLTQPQPKYVYVIKAVFTAKPLQNNPVTPPTTTPTTPSSNINMNSGYTAAEIAQMKKDKQEEIRELEFNIRMSESEFKIMQKEFDNGIVTSEIDGFVVSVMDPEEALMNNLPVIKVSGGGGFSIQGSVSELKLDTLHVGDTVQIECWMSGTFCEGRISDIGDFPVTDQMGWYGDGNPNVSYYPFTVTIDGSENLQTGEYAQITYSTGSSDEDSFYMQCAFLRNENGVYYAYVRGEDGLLEKRRLEVGQIIYNGEAIRVYSGLSMSDYVAFPYGSNLKDGTETVITSDMSALYGYDY